MSTAEFHYVGDELELFAAAQHWKSYFARRLRPWLRGEVLEVGAGLGGVTRFLLHADVMSWTCLEPDARLAERFQRDLPGMGLPVIPSVAVGVLNDLAATPAFDAIAYIDVLEHIADDAAELANAAERLRPNGALVVLAPAHQWLYSPFDAAIGHHRRYTAASLRALTPAGLTVETWFYLDALGLALSLGNRLLLRQRMPTRAQIAVWDRGVVPLARVVDPVLCHAIGKTVVMIWRKRGA